MNRTAVRRCLLGLLLASAAGRSASAEVRARHVKESVETLELARTGAESD